MQAGLALVVASVLAGSVAACGGGSSEPTSASLPTVSSSTTPTPSPSRTATPKPATSKPAPLSPFENEAPVKVARKWAAAYARDVNANRHELQSAQRYESPAGVTALPPTARTDWGKYYPGPLPFTPVNVKVTGGHAEISFCAWITGFSLNPKTHHPAEKKQIAPGTFQLSRHHGHWLVDNALQATADCNGVKVEGVKW